MHCIPTEIPEVVIVESRVFTDERGSFRETWHARKLAEAGLDVQFVQDNHSQSRRGVLRGLHYQIQQPQGKLIDVVRGAIFDVAVDLRRSSPTFGRWAGCTLNAGEGRMLYVPPGFAHGFYVLSDVADVCYKCTDFYAPQHERTLLWNDPDVGIEWPIDGPPVISAKDAAGRFLADAECFA
jgi:dTDP-4-dehydrorhamnose 3,5-epimerase